MMQTNLLNNIAFDIVKDKVISDQLKEAQNIEQNEKETNAPKVDQENEVDNFPDIDEPDSEEERIIQKELSRRKEQSEMIIEKKKEKQTRRYGELRDIVETEFLDTMLKNDKVICHFYHSQFERCKIMDKHL